MAVYKCRVCGGFHELYGNHHHTCPVWGYVRCNKEEVDMQFTWESAWDLLAFRMTQPTEVKSICMYCGKVIYSPYRQTQCISCWQEE